MSHRLRNNGWLRAVAGFAGLTAIAWATPGAGQTLTTSSIANFNGYPVDGSLPAGGTVVDRFNPDVIYGTTTQGGDRNAGAVYKLTGAAGGRLRKTIIYSFKAFPDLGAPTGRLYQDASGALYGGCIAGGVPGPAGHFVNNGGIFKLTPPPGGQGAWTETILHTFGGYHQGILNFNVSGLVSDGYGNLYGTVFIGRGNIFRISPDGKYRDVHDFEGPDGQGPTSPLTMGPNGALYGVTEYGGTHPCLGYGCGTVYSLTPTSRNGMPVFRTIFGFDSGPGGNSPTGPVAVDASGAIFGTNTTKKIFDAGVVFKVQPATSVSPATETVAYQFADRLQPFGGVVFDQAGGIYSTYQQGFSPYTVEFYLPPSASHPAQYTTLVELLKLHGGGLHTDGATVSADPASGDVLLDDILNGGLSQENGNGSVFRLRIKPIAP